MVLFVLVFWNTASPQHIVNPSPSRHIVSISGSYLARPRWQRHGQPYCPCIRLGAHPYLRLRNRLKDLVFWVNRRIIFSFTNNYATLDRSFGHIHLILSHLLKCMICANTIPHIWQMCTIWEYTNKASLTNIHYFFEPFSLWLQSVCFSLFNSVGAFCIWLTFILSFKFCKFAIMLLMSGW